MRWPPQAGQSVDPGCLLQFLSWANSPLGIESQQRGHAPIRSEFHRARRYPFAANIELTDVRSEGSLTARTTDLSLLGCYASTTSPFPKATKVSLRTMHGGTSLTALGKAVYSTPSPGMGIAFTTIEPSSQAILDCEPEDGVDSNLLSRL